MKDFYRSQLRLPIALHESLREAAARHGRSLNAELVARLQQSFTGPAEAAPVPDAEIERTLLEYGNAIDKRLMRAEGKIRDMRAAVKSEFESAVRARVKKNPT